MKTQFTREACEIETQEQLTRIFSELLQKAYPGSPKIEILSPVDVTEGAEKCGYGDLHITGVFRAGKNNYGASVEGHCYRIDSTGSGWRNYGAPHGAKYDIVAKLVGMSAAEISALGK